MESYTSNTHTVACLGIQPCKLLFRLGFRKKIIIDAVNKNFLITLYDRKIYTNISNSLYYGINLPTVRVKIKTKANRHCQVMPLGYY